MALPHSFPQSHKIYVPGSREGVRVPMREIRYRGGTESWFEYDTSGPYTDPTLPAPIAPLPRLRAPWISSRRAIHGSVTQLAYARAGEITPEMEFVTIRENLLREGAGPEPQTSSRSRRKSQLPETI